MIKENKTKDLRCHYSDLLSPLAYDECQDYDGIGNQGRLVTVRKIKNKKRFLIRKKNYE